MKNEILKRNFILSDVNGKTICLGDLRKVFNHFKFSFQYLGSNCEVGLEINVTATKEVKCSYKDNVFSRHVTLVKTSDFQYVIRDGFGRKYCPKFLYSVLVKAYEKEYSHTNNLNYLYYRGYKNGNRLRRKGYCKGFNNLRRNSRSLAEGYTKSIRNWKDYQPDFYWDEYPSQSQSRNWKSYRKKQVKAD